MESIRTAEFVRSAPSAREFLADDGRPQVAFVGRSNVGKSSLLNTLLGRRGLARTSSTPGRTQAVNYFLINERVWFVDLPGYGWAKTSKQERERWARLMEDYFETALPRVVVVLLVDAKVAGTRLDAEAVQYLQGMGAEPLVVATKIDKVPRSRRHRQIQELKNNLDLDSGGQVIELSATTGEGVRELWRQISARLQKAQ